MKIKNRIRAINPRNTWPILWINVPWISPALVLFYPRQINLEKTPVVITKLMGCICSSNGQQSLFCPVTLCWRAPIILTICIVNKSISIIFQDTYSIRNSYNREEMSIPRNSFVTDPTADIVFCHQFVNFPALGRYGVLARKYTII